MVGVCADGNATLTGVKVALHLSPFKPKVSPMIKLLASLMLTLVLIGSCLAQQTPFAYGQPSDLKGLKKLYIDTGADTQSRNAIIKDLEKSKLGFEVMDDIEDADILLGFGAGKVTDRATGTIGDGDVDIRTRSSRTGTGVVIARARGKDRIVHSFTNTQEANAWFKRRPVTNFTREFLKLYKKANDLK